MNFHKGVRSRNRQCRDLRRAGCEGDTIEEEPCDKGPCSFWTQWSGWSQCSCTRGTSGLQKRTRSCRSLTAYYKTSDQCVGSSREQRRCDCPMGKSIAFLIFTVLFTIGREKEWAIQVRIIATDAVAVDTPSLLEEREEKRHWTTYYLS